MLIFGVVNVKLKNSFEEPIDRFNRNIKILFVSALDAVPELTSILPDLKSTSDIIKKPVALDDFISTVRTALTR